MLESNSVSNINISNKEKRNRTIIGNTENNNVQEKIQRQQLSNSDFQRLIKKRTVLVPQLLLVEYLQVNNLKL